MANEQGKLLIIGCGHKSHSRRDCSHSVDEAFTIDSNASIEPDICKDVESLGSDDFALMKKAEPSAIVFEHFPVDHYALVKQMRKEFPDLPIVIMGSDILRNYKIFEDFKVLHTNSISLILPPAVNSQAIKQESRLANYLRKHNFDFVEASNFDFVKAKEIATYGRRGDKRAFPLLTPKYISDHLSERYMEMERKLAPLLESQSSPKIDEIRKKVVETRDEVIRGVIRDFYILHSNIYTLPAEIEVLKGEILRPQTHPNGYSGEKAITDYKTTRFINCTGFHYSEGLFGSYKNFVVWGPEMTIVVSNTNSKELKKLLAESGDKVDINRYAPDFGNNALLLAVAKGWTHLNSDNKNPDRQEDIITTLLSTPQLDVNTIHLYNGMTALHIACARGDNPEFISKLIQAGANIDAIDIHGRKPIDLLNMSYESLQLLISTMVPSGFGEELHSGEKYPENKSDLATLPTRDERSENIKKICSLLTQPKQSSSEIAKTDLTVSCQQQVESLFDDPMIVNFILAENTRLKSSLSSSYWDRPDAEKTVDKIARHANEGTEIAGSLFSGLFSNTKKFSGKDTRETLFRLGVKGANLPDKKINSDDVRIAVSDILSQLKTTPVLQQQTQTMNTSKKNR